MNSPGWSRIRMVKHGRKNDNPNDENKNPYAQQFPEAPAKKALV